jgi:hypothetical protein
MRRMQDAFTAIITLTMITELVATPEMRANWARTADWDLYASKYTD